MPGWEAWFAGRTEAEGAGAFRRRRPVTAEEGHAPDPNLRSFDGGIEPGHLVRAAVDATSDAGMET